MRLSNDRVKIVPYEPNLHAPLVYRWFHSGDYQSFNDAARPVTIEMCMSIQNAFVILNPINPREVYGMFALKNINDVDRNLEIHAVIVKEYQNKGIVKDAARFMIYHIMNCLNFYKVIAIMREDNLACEKAAKDMGFELEGMLKHHRYVDGEFKNMKQYFMTKGMFNKRYKQQIEAEVKGDNPC